MEMKIIAHPMTQSICVRTNMDTSTLDDSTGFNNSHVIPSFWTHGYHKLSKLN